MRSHEARQLIAILRGAYPKSEWNPYAQEIYEKFLIDLPLAATQEVVLEHVANEKWMPAISEIRHAMIRKVRKIGTAQRALRIVMGSSLPGTEDELALAKEALTICGGKSEMRRTTAPLLWRKQFTETYDRLVEEYVREINLKSLTTAMPQLRPAITKELR